MSANRRILEIPELALVALIGAPDSGEAAFARRHFAATEILPPDGPSSPPSALDTLFYLLDKRLAHGRLTAVDATHFRVEDRRKLIEHARRYYCQAEAIVIHRQAAEWKSGLERDGFAVVHLLDGAEDVEVRRTRLCNNTKHESGPFDLIGDLHGCAGELRALLAKLGWERRDLDTDAAPWGRECYRHPAGRRAVFLGDLVDRGPAILDTLRIVRNMATAGTAFCVTGNHDDKLARWLKGRGVQVKHGLEQSVAELAPLDDEGRRAVRDFLDGLISHYVFDGGRLVAAHAGLREEMHGREARPVRAFCLYGETTGETDEFGLPVRCNWAADYRGRAMVVYGHTPVSAPGFVHNTVNIDTGAVFGGRLTALRYPEREFVDVPAAREYARPARAMAPEASEAAAPANRSAE
ncbi:MAG: metallophosphoesterase [Bryobacterales bacterium]|nr:metallophosphoesterase [Bryobacterales bacterium]